MRYRRFQLLFICALSWFSVATATAADPSLIARGKALFERKWNYGDTQSQRGDGLGPLHNDRSCVACHSQGGAGGGGPLKNNVDVLALQTPTIAEARFNLVAKMRAIHPGFLVGGAVQSHLILHRFGANPQYAKLRARLVGEDAEALRFDESAYQRRMQNTPVARREVLGVPFVHVQRNSSAMFGNGVIDAIPDGVIRDYARDQARRFPPMAGRPAPAGDDGIGRFGWRGQAETLHDFVVGACAAELGLQTESDAQPVDPFQPQRDTSKVEDLHKGQVKAMVAFVASLPAPTQQIPTDSAAALKVRYGEKLFNQVGCGVCHPKDLGDVRGVYSDLLLHAVGETLADPVGPMPSRALVQAVDRELQAANRKEQSGRLVAGAYYGGKFGVAMMRAAMKSRSKSAQKLVRLHQYSLQEFRTPPLWGVRDSAPYMHDGRAATLVEAIVLHGGQARPASTTFFNLKDGEQGAVLAFLNSLAAPPEVTAISAAGE